MRKHLIGNKHKTTHGMSYTRFYKSWKNMKYRCDNPNIPGYENYGGRGITYDPKWKYFENFFKDMYFKYLYAIKQLKINQPSIERINVNGNYNFENCIFINKPDQNKNTTRTNGKLLEFADYQKGVK